MLRDNRPLSPFLSQLTNKRGPQFLSLLRCPVTNSPIIAEGNLLINQDNPAYQYTVENNILYLVSPEQEQSFAQQTARQAAQKEADGWQPPSVQAFRQLPQTALSGWPASYWQNRALATAEMWRALEAIRIAEGRLPIGPMGTAVDLTDTMGWLGYGLDVSGYATIVIGQDLGKYGLGAFEYSRYLRVHGSLTKPPLAENAFDLVVFSFSLQMLETPTVALENAIKLLKKSGHLIVLSDQDEQNRLKTAEQFLKDSGLEVKQQRVGAMGKKLLRVAKNLVGHIPDIPPLLIASTGK